MGGGRKCGGRKCDGRKCDRKCEGTHAANVRVHFLCYCYAPCPSLPRRSTPHLSPMPPSKQLLNPPCAQVKFSSCLGQPVAIKKGAAAAAAAAAAAPHWYLSFSPGSEYLAIAAPPHGLSMVLLGEGRPVELRAEGPGGARPLVSGVEREAVDVEGWMWRGGCKGGGCACAAGEGRPVELRAEGPGDARPLVSGRWWLWRASAQGGV